MELTRRGFLEMVGLGGVALTLPKPLKIVAAKMADLAPPPLHVGYCELRSSGTEREPYGLLNVSLCGPRDLSMARFEDFYGKWCLSLNFRRPNGNLLQFLKIRACHVSSEHRLAGELSEPPVWTRPVIYGMNTKPWIWPAEDVAELWLVPGDPFGQDAPKYPLPKRVYAALHGVRYRQGGRTDYGTVGQFDHVRLDRAKAIELGIVNMLEPADDFRPGVGVHGCQ